VLDILAERGLAASFFVVGERLRDAAARRCAERAQAAGHWIGNHTMTHGAPLGGRPEAAVAEAEIAATQALLGTLAHPDRLFRPNGRGAIGPHLLSPAAAALLERDGYTIVTWNLVPRDWEAPERGWVERARAGMAAQDWSLLVLHEHYLAPMMDTLPAFLDAMAAEGVRFVQEFPPDCVMMRRGRAAPELRAIVTAN